MPAVTRRRTGNLPPPRNPVGSTDNGDEVEEDLNKPEGSNVRKRARGTTKVEASKDGGDFEDDSDGEGEQDDEEDYTGSGKRPAKRRKVESSAKSKATRKRTNTTKPTTNGTKTKLRGNRGKLQNMLSMPLDIVYEVCMLLSPADLLSLARTSKSLREILMSRSSISVWKSARRSLYQPDVHWNLPIEFSEPEWAALAFVRACTECNTKNAQSVEWCFKRRLCMACNKSNYVFEGRFKKEYPGADPAVLELLPYTHIGISTRGYPSNKRYFWRSDLENMVEYREKLLKDVSMRRVGATAALNELDTEEAEATSLFMEETICLFDLILPD